MSESSTQSKTDDGASGEEKSPGEKVRGELERLLETVWSSSERAMDALGLGGLAGKELQPRIDVIETETSVEVTADIPGIEPEAVNISLAGNMLTIAGCHPKRAASEKDEVHRHERPEGRFSRSIPLPVSVEHDSVNAVARNGVLEITLEKPASEQPRKIQIQVKPRTTPPSE